MKTISRLCRRCVCAAFAIVLLVFAVNAATFIGLCFRFVSDESAGSLRGGLRAFSGRFIADEDGRPIPEADALSDVSACAWVMLLGDEGDVLWSLRLPDALNHRYTVGQVAAFTRWYLEDYPVFVYRNDYGLVVFGMPEGSVTRFNLFLDSPVLDALLSSFCPLLLTDTALILAACVVAMFAITATTNNTTVLNYENQLINKYEAWEERLDQRQEAIEAKEKELGIMPE